MILGYVIRKRLFLWSKGKQLFTVGQTLNHSKPHSSISFLLQTAGSWIHSDWENMCVMGRNPILNSGQSQPQACCRTSWPVWGKCWVKTHQTQSCCILRNCCCISFAICKTRDTSQQRPNTHKSADTLAAKEWLFPCTEQLCLQFWFQKPQNIITWTLQHSALLSFKIHPKSGFGMQKKSFF